MAGAIFMDITLDKEIGGSLFLELPQEVLDQLDVKLGDDVFRTETPTGLLLTAKDPEI